MCTLLCCIHAACGVFLEWHAANSIVAVLSACFTPLTLRWKRRRAVLSLTLIAVAIAATSEPASGWSYLAILLSLDAHDFATATVFHLMLMRCVHPPTQHGARNPDEVATIFTAPISLLQKVHSLEELAPGRRLAQYNHHSFPQGARIWGLTGHLTDLLIRSVLEPVAATANQHGAGPEATKPAKL